MAIQQRNAVCEYGLPKKRSSGLEGLFNFQVHEAEVLWLKKYIYIFIPNIFLTTLTMNKQQRVYTILKKTLDIEVSQIHDFLYTI